jgi:hypothetical protein
VPPPATHPCPTGFLPSRTARASTSIHSTSPTKTTWRGSTSSSGPNTTPAANASATARDDPPQLVRRDLDAAIADLVHEAPTDTTVVVFHSAVLNYVDPSARAAFEDTVRALPCHWIANEGPGVLPGITRRLTTSAKQIGGRFVVSFDGHPVALAGGHGQSLD